MFSLIFCFEHSLHCVSSTCFSRILKCDTNLSFDKLQKVFWIFKKTSVSKFPYFCLGKGRGWLTIVRHSDGHLALLHVEESQRSHHLGRNSHQLRGGVPVHGVSEVQAASVRGWLLLPHVTDHQHHPPETKVHATISQYYKHMCHFTHYKIAFEFLLDDV